MLKEYNDANGTQYDELPDLLKTLEGQPCLRIAEALGVSAPTASKVMAKHKLKTRRGRPSAPESHILKNWLGETDEAEVRKLTAHQIARLLRIEPATVYNLSAKQHIPYRRVNGNKDQYSFTHIGALVEAALETIIINKYGPIVTRRQKPFDPTDSKLHPSITPETS